MQAFTRLTSRSAPLLRDNIDTDSIMPSREMRAVAKTGLCDGLFANWRYLDSASRTLNPDFILNQSDFVDAQILLGGHNFGCGSSREFAVWALVEYGIRAIIAPSFGTIFAANCIRNGILPVCLPPSQVETLATIKAPLTIDLHAQTIKSGRHDIAFHIDPRARHMLLEGLDEIGMTQKHQAEIDAFIAQDRKKRAWCYL